MADISIDEIKSKFQKLQSETQRLKEEKVGYEAQLSTLQTQYDEQLANLLKETGTSTLEEAVAVCKKKQEDLNKLKEELSKTLDGYLQTVGDSSQSGSLDSALGDFLS